MAVYNVLGVSRTLGVKVRLAPLPLIVPVTLPPALMTVKLLVVTLVTASLNVTCTVLLSTTLVALLMGTVLCTVGGVTSAPQVLIGVPL